METCTSITLLLKASKNLVPMATTITERFRKNENVSYNAFLWILIRGVINHEPGGQSTIQTILQVAIVTHMEKI